MNKHPESWRDGQIYFLNGISCYFEANFKLMFLCYCFLELFVCAILYVSSNYVSNWVCVCICIIANHQRGSRGEGGGLGGERGYLWGRAGMLLQLFWSTTSHLKAIIIIIIIITIIITIVFIIIIIAVEIDVQHCCTVSDPFPTPLPLNSSHLKLASSLQLSFSSLFCPFLLLL